MALRELEQDWVMSRIDLDNTSETAFEYQETMEWIIELLGPVECHRVKVLFAPREPVATDQRIEHSHELIFRIASSLNPMITRL